MPTITGPAGTRSISIAAPPSEVFDFLADAQNLPRWAPGFAPSIEPDGDNWLVNNGPDQLQLTLRTSREHGTVDFLRTQDLRTGGRSRVLPNGDGSEYLFTICFPAGTPEAAVADQMAIVEEELQTVRKLCEDHSAA